MVFRYVCREPVRSGPVHSLVTRRTIRVTAKESTLTRRTHTVWLLESQTAVAPTILTPLCPVPVPARVTRLRQRSRRLNTTPLGHHRKVRIWFYV